MNIIGWILYFTIVNNGLFSNGPTTLIREEYKTQTQCENALKQLKHHYVFSGSGTCIPMEDKR